jgi:hypothetical protein
MRPLPPAPAPPHAPAAARSPSPRPSAPRAAPPPWQMAGPHEAEALITAQQHRSTHRPGRSAMSERQGSTTTLEGSRYRGRRRRRPSPHLGLRVRSNGFASGSACNARPPPSSGVSERECVTVCVRAGFLLFLSGSRCDQCSIGSFHERHCAAL